MINDVYSPEDLRRIAANPHIIGWLVGKDKLGPLHSKWIKDLWLPKRHTALQAHRGAYKTTACTEVGIVWRLLFNPNNRIALIRETWAGSNDTLKTIATYMNHELVQELFRALHGIYPRATVERDGRLVYSFKETITKEGSVDAYGIDTVPTGSHYDDILADDIVTIKDRFSRAKRERTKENVREIMTNILDPGKFMRNVGTPWHKEDAWEILPGAVKYDVYQTGILDDQQIEEKRATTTRVMFAANYELIHENTADLIFANADMGPWVEGAGRVYAHIDASYGGKDTTALTLMQHRDSGGIQAWGKVYKGHVETSLPLILRDLALRAVGVVYCETNGDKGFLAKLMKKGPARANGVKRVETYHEKQNKHLKIVNHLGHHWDDITWDPNTDPDYLSQICDYAEGSEPDDAPDSAASLLREVFFKKEISKNTSDALLT